MANPKQNEMASAQNLIGVPQAFRSHLGSNFEGDFHVRLHSSNSNSSSSFLVPPNLELWRVGLCSVARAIKTTHPPTLLVLLFLPLHDDNLRKKQREDFKMSPWIYLPCGSASCTRSATPAWSCVLWRCCLLRSSSCYSVPRQQARSGLTTHPR